MDFNTQTTNWKRAFTMVEMLVVIGIIAVLMGATMVAYSRVTKKAQMTRGRELVLNTATALNVLFDRQQTWPKRLLTAAEGEGILTAEAAAPIAAHGLMSLSYDSGAKKLSGLDRFGIVTPWATEVLKRLPSGSGDSARVPSGGTIHDHRLHFALDDDGDGITEAKVGARTVRVRANAVVWCWGMNGKEDDYEKSQAERDGADDIYSWSSQQEAR